MMNATQFLLSLLTIVVVVQSILLLLLYRQVGALILSRVESAPPDGPDVGAVLTEEMADVVGFKPQAVGEGKGVGVWHTLLLLTRRGCPACDTALQSLPDWIETRDLDPSPTILIAGDGLAELDTRTKTRLRSSGVVTKESLEALPALGVGLTPFAFMLDAEGRVLAKGVVTQEEHLWSMERQMKADLEADEVAPA